ncbi:MAG: hypothetical protein GWO08_16955 [Gammaproteobacteria bacterium]|nr:hypothetical protein [Phycisphaerae bacterium]NIR95274.1 hypothetical protein [Gammaproteobacteria bacterium]NIW44156.1 hypothetical protein [Gammaproteobacteria bacterium]
MARSWQDSIYQQRAELAEVLREPLATLADKCVPFWGDRLCINQVLREEHSNIPFCNFLYAMNTEHKQISDNVGATGIQRGHFGRDRSDRPYMQEQMPEWGFLLSDAYISHFTHHPALTALQVVRKGSRNLGFIGANFKLRDLPVTSELYEEPGEWRQIKGDPAIRGTVFQQSRTDSPMDQNMEQSLSILEEFITERGVFQCQIHFSSSQAIIWMRDNPFLYRMLDREALIDPDICLVYPSYHYDRNAAIPQGEIGKILDNMCTLRLNDETIYLRTASINIYNGMVSLTFSCDGSHYMRYDEFLQKETTFWFGEGVQTPEA